MTSFVWVFFYGAFMNCRILAENNVSPAEIYNARLSGYELLIRPRVNLARSDKSSVYGAAALVAHEDLGRIYAGLETNFGLKYLPAAVLAESLADGALRPALCYIVPEMRDATAKPEVVRQLSELAREAGFPDWYIRHIESFGRN